MKEVQEYVNKLSKLKATSNNNSISNVNSNLSDITDSITKSNSKVNKILPKSSENSTGIILL